MSPYHHQSYIIPVISSLYSVVQKLRNDVFEATDPHLSAFD